MAGPSHTETESSQERLRRLYGFMAPRLFVAHRDELTAGGFGWRQQDGWIRNGRLIRLMLSVYAYGRDVESRDALWRAAVLAAGEGSALIGRSACEKWGIIRPRDQLPGLVEIGSSRGQARKLVGASPATRGVRFEVASRTFKQSDVRWTTVDHTPVANPTLAMIDLAARADEREVLFAFLEACRLKHFRMRDLEHCYARLSGRRGVGKLKPCLALWVPELERIRSVLEGWFLLVWLKRGLPIPKVNEKVFGLEVDIHFSRARLALELDGDAFHSAPVQKALDRQKQAHLESQGVEVMRATYRQFAADPEGTVDRVNRRRLELLRAAA